MLKKKILIIDDDADTLHLLKKRLEASGYECLCAMAVSEAVEAVHDFSPDLVLLDLLFHGTDGTAFLKRLYERALYGEKTPPVIVVSGLDEKDIVDYVMGLGANGFISKPVDPTELLTLIKDNLQEMSPPRLH